MRECSLGSLKRDAAGLGCGASYPEGADLARGEGFEAGCCDRKR